MGFLEQYKGVITDEMPDFTNIGAGQKALCRPAIGQTYLWMMLKFTILGVAATRAQLLAQVTNIRVLVDGVAKFECSGAIAVYLAEYYRPGCVGDTGVLPLFFARPWMEALQNQDAAAYGLAGIDSFTVEVTLAGGATIDAIKGTCTTTENEPLGEHIVTTVLGRNFGSASLETINDLPTQPDWSMYAMHFVTATAITSIEVLADGSRVIFGTPDVLNQRLLYPTSARGVQAGFTPIEFASRNRNVDSLPLSMNRLSIKTLWGGIPGAYSIITEVVQRGNIKGIPQ